MSDKEARALVQLAMSTLACNQRALAERLSVSPTQISKWKKGEHMSAEMQDRLRGLTGIGKHDASFVVRAGTKNDAERWKRVVDYLADRADEEAETGYSTYLFEDDADLRYLLCSLTFSTLENIGLEIPSGFPNEMDIDIDEDDESSVEAYANVLDEHPVPNTIKKIFKAMSNLSGFNSAYIQYLIDDEKLELWDTDAVNIEPCLIDLAASKIDIDAKLAPKQMAFRREVRRDYVKWLTLVKDKAFRAGIPLRAELLDLVFGDDEQAGHAAEAESLGFNENRLHPDIYMNEILVGMRIIHQVLPAILTKLGIKEEFELDHSKLSLRE